MSKTIYLASGFGFSASAKALVLPPIVSALEALGLEVWEPFARNQQVDFSAKGWTRKICNADVADVKNANAVFAVVNGNPPDEGVCIELGIAVALGKPVFLFRDDFRRCTDSEEFPLNLMFLAGLPEDWRSHWFESIVMIGWDSKALKKWAEPLPENRGYNRHAEIGDY
jgi:nucleoside 2-deoxyribosyltransferase